MIVCGDWMSPGIWEMLSPQSSATPHVFGRQGMAWSSPRGICFIWIAAWPRLSWFLARSCIHGSSEPTKKACMKLSVQFEMFDLKRLSGSPVSTCHESQERTAAPHPWTTCPTLRRAARWLGCAHSTLDLTRHSLGTGDETMWGFLASWNLAKSNACWLMLNDIETCWYSWDINPFWLAAWSNMYFELHDQTRISRGHVCLCSLWIQSPAPSL